MSHHYWQQRFDGDPDIVGRTVELNSLDHTIVGVLPPIPRYPNSRDAVYMPASACPFRTPGWFGDRNTRPLTVLGRVVPGATLEEVEAELDRIAGQLRGECTDAYPQTAEHHIRAVPLHEELTRQARPTLLLLWATAGFVLLIVCANVVNLTLARLARREREVSIRTALGAGRRRLLQQSITESALLALIGGALGLLLAGAGVDLLVQFAGRFTPWTAQIEVDANVALFTLVVSLAAGVAVGSVPGLP